MLSLKPSTAFSNTRTFSLSTTRVMQSCHSSACDCTRTPQKDLHVRFYLSNERVRYAITRANVQSIARPVIPSLTRLVMVILNF